MKRVEYHKKDVLWIVLPDYLFLLIGLLAVLVLWFLN